MSAPLATLSELHKTHQAGQERLVYFLLGVTGAAIAFATQKTESQSLSWWLLPLGFSVLCWAISFYFGCKAITWSHTTMRREIYLLQAKEENASFKGAEHGGWRIDAHFANLDKAIAKWSQFYAWQFRLLLCGGGLYCLWRVAELVRVSQ